MADAAETDAASDAIILEKLRAQKRPAILALNKSDRIKKDAILVSIDSWARRYPFEAVVPISALHGTQVADLVAAMEKHLPDGPPYFPEDALTDMPERFIAGEIVREKVFRLTGEEIPYAVAVTVASFNADDRKNLIRINATIHVERTSQKGIVIGRHGAKLKQIGQAARQDIERMLGAKVFLKLFVRVQKNWSRDTKALRKFGY
jgi:GTP-binding protein Era